MGEGGVNGMFFTFRPDNVNEFWQSIMLFYEVKCVFWFLFYYCTWRRTFLRHHYEPVLKTPIHSFYIFMIARTHGCPVPGAMLVDQSAQLFAGDINHVARAHFLSMIPTVLNFILEKPVVPAKIVQSHWINLYGGLELFFFFKLSEDFTMYLCGSTALNTIMVRKKKIHLALSLLLQTVMCWIKLYLLSLHCTGCDEVQIFIWEEQCSRRDDSEWATQVTFPGNLKCALLNVCIFPFSCSSFD